MNSGINESKTLTNDKSCKCKCKFYGRKCNLNQSGTTKNIDVSVKIRKKIKCTKKLIFGILLHAVVKMINM